MTSLSVRWWITSRLCKLYSVIATNGGKPQDYEGLHKSDKKGLPVVAINTTAGTSAEITINYVITDEERKS